MRTFCFIVIALLSWATVACNTNNDPQPDNQDIILSDTSATTGQLIVRVYQPDGRTVANAEVTLYHTFEDIGRRFDLLYLQTTNSGRANFGYINYGNYYVLAEANIGGRLHSAIDVVQVRARRTVEMPLRVFP